jgi:hypothetical protein
LGLNFKNKKNEINVNLTSSQDFNIGTPVKYKLIGSGKYTLSGEINNKKASIYADIINQENAESEISSGFFPEVDFKQISSLTRWKKINYINNTYFAIASNDSFDALASSTDSINWNQINFNLVSGVYSSSDVILSTGTPFANSVTYINDIAYGDNTYIVFLLGFEKQYLRYNINENVWKTYEFDVGLQNANSYTSVIYANSLFVAAGFNSSKIITSSDGKVWTQRKTINLNNAPNIKYINSKFILNSSSYVISSDNGTTWSTNNLISTIASNTEAAYGNTKYVIIGYNSSTSQYGTYTSSDAATWTFNNVTTFSNSLPNNLTFANGFFYASDYSLKKIYKSSDALTWTANSVDVKVVYLSYFNNIFISPYEVSLDINNLASNGGIMYSDDAINWNFNGSVLPYSWESITYGKEKFVAVSSSGAKRVMYSNDVLSWNYVSVTTNSWKSIAFGNDIFIAVSSDGTNRAMYSSDGITWSNSSNIPSNSWKSITHGNGIFVAVADSGNNRIANSLNGITWNSYPSTEQNNWTDVIYGKDKFIAISSNGTNRIMYSRDSITWYPITSIEQNQWVSITYGNDLFVAVSNSGDNRVMISSDGFTWKKVKVESYSWKKIIFYNNLFVAVATSGNYRIMYSPDGINWNYKLTPENNTWNSLANSQSYIIGVSSDGNNRTMFASNVNSWNKYNKLERSYNKSICFSDELKLFLSVSYNRILVTYDGSNFSDELIFSSFLSQSFIKSDWRYILSIKGYKYGLVLLFGKSSTVNINFTNLNSKSFSSYNNISAYNNGYFYSASNCQSNTWECAALGGIYNNIIVAVSSDGTNRVMKIAVNSLESYLPTFTAPTWTSISVPQNSWKSIAYGNEKFVAVSNSGTNRVMYSINEGTSWISISVTQNSWKSIAFGNKTFVAIADSGTNRIMYSIDAINWTYMPTPEQNTWEQIIYNNDLFVAISSDGINRLIYSIDGINWSTAKIPLKKWKSITYGNGTYVGVTNNDDNITLKFKIFSPIQKKLNNNINSIYFNTISFTNNLFFGISLVDNTNWYSYNGTLWIPLYNPQKNTWKKFIYGNNLYLAISSDGDNRVITSNDLIDWNLVVVPHNSWQDIVYNNNLFVAVSSDGNNRVIYSNDGFNWTSVFVTQNSWKSIAYGNNLFVAVGSGGNNNIMYSSNGINWTYVNSSESWNDIIYKNGLFIAVGDNGKKINSANGINWTYNNLQFDDNLLSISASNDTQMITSSPNNSSPLYRKGNPKIFISRDGIKFNAIDSNDIYGNVEYGNNTFFINSNNQESNYELNFVHYGNNKFIILGNLLQLDGNGNTTYKPISLVSSDGVNWIRDILPKEKWSNVIWGSSQYLSNFVAIRNDANSTDPFMIAISSDGLNWKKLPIYNSTSLALKSITFGDFYFVSISSDGVILKSKFLTTLDNYWEIIDTYKDNSYSWESITWGNSKYIAVSSAGDDRVITSSDGIEWTSVSVTQNSWKSIAFGDGKFIAVSSDGDFRGMYSTDNGQNWNYLPIPKNSWQNIIYKDGYFIAISSDGIYQILLINSTTLSFFEVRSNENAFWTSIAKSNNLTVAVSKNAKNRIATNNDIINNSFWIPIENLSEKTSKITFDDFYNLEVYDYNRRSDFNKVTSYTLGGGIYGNGKIIILSSAEGTNVNYIWYSDNGLSFKQILLNSAVRNKNWIDTAYGNNLFVALSYSGEIMYTSDETNWSFISTINSSYTYNKIYFANNLFFVTGSNGGTYSGNSILLSSSNGTTWTVNKYFTGISDLQKMIYSVEKNIYIIISYHEDLPTYYNKIHISKNYTDWEKIFLPIKLKHLVDIAYGNGVFVILTRYDLVNISSDGINWETYSIKKYFEWNSIVFLNGLFTIIDNNGNIGISNDGINWTYKHFLLNDPTEYFLSEGLIGLNNPTEKYILVKGIIPVNEYILIKIFILNLKDSSLNYSTFYKLYIKKEKYYIGDFISLEVSKTISNDLQDGNKNLYFDFSDPQIISKNYFSTVSNNVSIIEVNNLKTNSISNGSVDIYDLSLGKADSNDNLPDYVIGNKLKLDSNTYSYNLINFGELEISQDELNVLKDFNFDNNFIINNTFNGISSPQQNSWTSITYGNNTFVAVSSDGTNRAMYSSDGITWKLGVTVRNTTWLSVTYGNGIFVAVGSTGTHRVMVSNNNGVNWSEYVLPLQNTWSSIAYGNGLFVAISSQSGESNRSIYSVNGINWNISGLPIGTWNFISFSNNIFIVTGASGEIVTSSDGINWYQQTSQSITSAVSSIFGNGYYVILSGNKITYSKDYLNWTSNSITSKEYTFITYGEGLFICLAKNNNQGILISNNLINWSELNVPESSNWNSIAYGDGLFVAVSSSGTKRIMYGINNKSSKVGLDVGKEYYTSRFFYGKIANTTNNLNSKIFKVISKNKIFVDLTRLSQFDSKFDRREVDISINENITLSSIFGSQESAEYRFFDSNNTSINGTLFIKDNGVNFNPEIEFEINSLGVGLIKSATGTLNIYTESNLINFQNKTNNIVNFKIYKEK